MKRKLIGERRQTLIKMLKERVSPVIIAKTLSLDISTVRNYGIEKGLLEQEERRVKGHRTHLTNSQIATIIRRHLAGQSIYKIAKGTGIQWRTVRRIIGLFTFNPKGKIRSL
jgi:hypothetical protein